MPELTFIHKGKRIKLGFEGTPLLRDVLVESGFYVLEPCGGRGVCGKCRARISGNVSEPNERESNLNCRLVCQARLLGDAEVELLDNEEAFISVEAGACLNLPTISPDWKYGAAVDIGTTTVVLKLFDNKGECVGEASSLNPQRAFSADVIGRIAEAVDGKGEILKRLITECVHTLLENACKTAAISLNDVEKIVVTGNTAMLYLYTGRSPESISVSPFKADTLFGEHYTDKIYIPPCMDAFVGADVTCAVMASRMCEEDCVSLLCDIGTNGEIALYKNGVLYVTSAAAGPAFEGAEISCGCGHISGAVERVTVENGAIRAYTTDGTRAVGVCGSGLISAVAAFLELGYIDKSGYAERELKLSANGGDVILTQDDIRAVQLAKSAIVSAIELLLSSTETDACDIKTLYLSGGFGNKLDLASAVRIGLLPKELADKDVLLGNAALSGAIELLFDDAKIQTAESIARRAKHITLSDNEDFYTAFIKNIDFHN